jgi:hypothetical protein
MSTNKRGRLRPTHEWDLLVPLFEWPEQKRYEAIRPLVLFDVSVAERAQEVGLSQSTLYRRLGGFEAEGMESLFASETARKRKLPPAIRRLIVPLSHRTPYATKAAGCPPDCLGHRTGALLHPPAPPRPSQCLLAAPGEPPAPVPSRRGWRWPG